MNKPIVMEAGSYAYAPGVFQYSAGVGALPGYEIERVRFSRAVPLADGFARIKAHLEGLGRPLTAFCACELRSPAPFDEAGFEAFNRVYAGTLTDWGIMSGAENPVARSNVCPEVEPPSQPGFHAFCYTVESPGAAPTFAISGSAESPEGVGNYRDCAIRPGETSAEAIELKADWVLGEMQRRMSYFGAGWSDTTAAQAYTVFDVHPFIDKLARRHVIGNGLSWHYCRPPVVGLDYEMDCRRIFREHVVEVSG